MDCRFAADFGVAELPAGAHELPAVGHPDFGEEVLGFEMREEGQEGFIARGFVAGETLRIVRDQVDDAGEVAAEGEHGVRVGDGVVDAFDEDVLDEQAGLGSEGVGEQGGFEIGQGHGFVDGHERVAQGVGGGVKGNGDTQIFEGGFPAREGREFLEAVNAADGGDGDLGVREIEAVGVREDADGLQDIVEVVERFAHAHEDEVLDAVGEIGWGLRARGLVGLCPGGRACGFGGEGFVVQAIKPWARCPSRFKPILFETDLTGDEPLRDDLRGGEVLEETHAAGFAEGTGHAAADLGGEAQRVPA